MQTQAASSSEASSIESWIRRHKEKYGIALEGAERAEETTKTTLWQTNYQAQQNRHKGVQDNALETIDNAVLHIKRHGTDEDVEKSVRDAIKTLAEERIAHAAWDKRAVEPFRCWVERCETIRADCVAEAKRHEQEQPLLCKGFERQIVEAVALWRGVQWDDKCGVLSIV